MLRSSTRQDEDTEAQWEDISAKGWAPGILPEGSRFGGYVVGPCIGEGGMARIYSAEHEALQRQVALKVLLNGVDKDPEGRERFLREARMAAAIKHPNVVNIFDIGVHAGATYLVMELLDGVDLDSFVESRGPLDEATMIDVLMPIVSGLAAVHDAGIVHRDLKPGNIFLARGRDEELEPKLLDFGISKSISPGAMKVTSTRGLMMGTPFYMSPEAGRGLEVTALSDQYSLGVVLYECATGMNPFAPADTLADVVRRVIAGDYQPVSKLNPALSRRMVSIIERAMHVDPERRFPDMRAMGRELLCLAGRRTRITWGLSFGELSRAAAPAGPPQLLAISAPPPLSSASRHLKRYAVAAALFWALGWVGVEAFRGGERSALGEQAPSHAQGSLAALLPAPPRPPVDVPPAMSAADSPSSRATAPVTEPVLSAAVELQQAPLDDHGRRAARHRSRPAKARAPAAPKPTGEKPTGDKLTETETFVASQKLAPKEPRAERGTNNALIFD